MRLIIATIAILIAQPALAQDEPKVTATSICEGIDAGVASQMVNAADSFAVTEDAEDRKRLVKLRLQLEPLKPGPIESRTYAPQTARRGGDQAALLAAPRTAAHEPLPEPLPLHAGRARSPLTPCAGAPRT